MMKDKCKHEWEISQSAAQTGRGEAIPAFYQCEKCKTKLTASEVFLLETLKHFTGFQKYIAIVAVITSFIALLISILGRFA